MIFYILNLLMLVLYSIGIKAIRLKNGNKILAIIFTIHFTLISGFRAIGVGTDTYTYQRIFLQTEMSSVSSIIQNSKLIGYQLLMKFITTFFGSNYHIFLFIVAMITNSLIFFTVYKMNNRSISQAGYLYFILYYFISSMNISRQFLALSLCLVASRIMCKWRIHSSI